MNARFSIQTKVSDDHDSLNFVFVDELSSKTVYAVAGIHGALLRQKDVDATLQAIELELRGAIGSLRDLHANRPRVCAFVRHGRKKPRRILRVRRAKGGPLVDLEGVGTVPWSECRYP